MKTKTKLMAIFLSVVMLLGMTVAVSAETPAPRAIFTWDLKTALQSSEDLNAAGGTSPFTVMQIRFGGPSADTGTFAAMPKSGNNYGSPDGIPGVAIEPFTVAGANNGFYVSPGCNTNNGLCGAVAFGFTAPVSGVYTLQAEIVLRDGNTSTDSDNLYGVTEPEWYTLKGQKGAKENVHLFCGASGTAESITASYTLKAGETFYLVSDPNGNHWNDNVWLSGTVSLTETKAAAFSWDLAAALKSGADLNAAGGTSPFTVEQITFANPSAASGTFSAMGYNGNYYSPDSVPGCTVEPASLYVSPGCNTNNGICAAVAFGFTAPLSGIYALQADVTLKDGNTSADSDNLYGVTKPEWYTLKGKTGAKENIHMFSGASGTVEHITAFYTLKAGETFYLVSDPNGNHWNDNAYIAASVSLMEADTAGMAAPAAEENLLGGNLLFKNPDAAFDYNKEENHGILRFMGIDTKAGSLYPLGGLSSDPNGGYAGNGIHFNNYAGPQVGLSTNFRAAALAVIIPVDGNYTLSTTLNRVNTSTNSAYTESYVYVLNRGKKLYDEKFWHTEGGTAMSVTADLAAGDVLFLVSDPNGGENAWWEDTLSLGAMSLKLNSPVTFTAPDYGNEGFAGIDGGYYAGTKDGEKTGYVLAFTACMEGLTAVKGVTDTGIYVYAEGKAANPVQLSKGDQEISDYVSLIMDIADANKDTNVYAIPYVVVNGITFTGDTMTARAADFADNWVGSGN